jgi:hypothetical protein
MDIILKIKEALSLYADAHNHNRVIVRRLRAENEKLREDKARLLRLVEQAYKEGHVRGVSGYDDPAGYEEQDWLDSEVRQAIDAAREDV